MILKLWIILTASQVVDITKNLNVRLFNEHN